MDEARSRAFRILEEVTGQNAYANLALKDGLSADMPRQDRAFATALVYTTLEKLIYLDYVLSLYAKGRLQPRVRNLLRLGACQILFLDRVPDSAAVNETLQLAQQIGKGALKGYLNGVLRTVSREKNRIPLPEATPERLSVQYSWPLFLVEEMLREEGEEAAEAFLSAPAEHLTTVRFHPGRISREECMAKLGGEPGVLFEDCVRMRGDFDSDSTLYKNGVITPQGEASMAAVRALGADGGSVLDCCAAPGGKTVYIAQRMHTGRITAWDKYPHRVELIRKNAERCGFSDRITAETADASCPAGNEKFDFILADVPCSGLGVAAQKPEIKLHLTPDGLRELEKTQETVLESVAGLLKPGGVLVYSTCTVRRSENGGQIAAFLARHPEFARSSMSGLLGEKLEKAHDLTAGEVTLLPNTDRTDGFYIARLQKQ